MLRGDHGEFWLEPVAVSPEEERVRLEVRLEDAGAGLYRNSVLGRPHLVFRRSVEQPQLEIGATGRARRRRKKKRKLERNCGTRGENPPTPFSLTLSTQAFVTPFQPPPFPLSFILFLSFSLPFLPFRFIFFVFFRRFLRLSWSPFRVGPLDSRFLFSSRKGPGRETTISRARLTLFFPVLLAGAVRSYADKILVASRVACF